VAGRFSGARSALLVLFLSLSWFVLSAGSFKFAARFLAFVTSGTAFPKKPLLPEHQNYLRRWTICLSVRLLWRVFFPNVGNAHGVCGWLPFTLPSPPPCG
jgi:hypothetical protein